MRKNEKIAKMAKRANARLARLEKRGYTSPAYQSAQAMLEAIGDKRRSANGRRFKEAGRFKNKNEEKQYEALLKNFLGQKTSTLKGYRDYRSKILETAQEKYHYRDFGVTDDEYMSIWENLPDSNNDRMYGSDEIVNIIKAYSNKYGDEGELTVEELVDMAQSSRNIKQAWKEAGLTVKDIKAVDIGDL